MANIVGVHLVMRSPLDCASETALAMSYRSRYFTTISFNQSVALFAFVFTFLGGPRGSMTQQQCSSSSVSGPARRHGRLSSATKTN